MRAFPLLFALLSVGCAQPNVAPISYGVPDGFVIARDIEPTSIPGIRVERVTYAYHDQPYHAVLVWPTKATGVVSVSTGTGDTSQDAAKARSTSKLVVSGTDPGRDAMVGTLEGVIRP